MRKFVLLCAAVVVSMSIAHAQFGVDNLKNKAKSAVGKAIDRKIEQEMNKAAERMVNKYWDKVFSKLYQEQPGGSSSKGAGTFPFVLDDNVTLEPSYDFQGSVTMLMESYKSNGKLEETVTMVMHGNVERQYSGTALVDQNSKEGETFIINDMKNGAMVMLFTTEGEKSSMAYRLQMAEIPDAEIEVEEVSHEAAMENANWEPIGNKEILGYNCRGYRMENEEAITDMWFAEEGILQTGLPMNYGSAMQGTVGEMPMGMLMEWDSTNRSSGERSVMRVTEIKPEAHLHIDMNDYPRITMGN